ncbi:outer membrane beta-barrel protein [Sphingomonas sp. GC_Shp_3]|uniref:outer membrane beta-barrel protein n=1 Tax=Sphingomonas sp. GC_Shp_3 TaxID=2937383 RepID=UPI002269E93E|nr:outer membrane beta-barrel protein [Sphingomonas sp. GC_Shp_3]
MIVIEHDSASTLPGKARSRFAAGLLAGAALFASGSAAAQSYRVTPTASVSYDDNLFRLPPAIRESLPDHGEDVVTYLAVNGDAQTRIGVIVVDAQAMAGKTFHANNPAVDTFNYIGKLSAMYKTGQATVDASASYLHAPVPFADSNSVRRVLRSTTDLNLDASHDLLGDFRAVGRFEYLKIALSGGGLTAYSSDRVTGSGGFGYYSPSGNSITLEYTRTQATGDSPRPVLIGNAVQVYRGDALDSSILSHIDYQITGLTSINGTFGYTKHNDRSVLNADFAGLVGNIALRWSPLPGLVVKPAFRRGFSSETLLFSNGVVATRYSLSVSETVFGRLGVNVGLSRENRRFRYDLRATDPFAVNRTEQTTVANAGLSYMTGLKFSLALTYEHNQRDSTRVDYPYAANTFTFTISRDFGS